MYLLADEGVERQIVEGLRLDGHTVAYIAEMSPGIDDEIILAQANDEQALLITLDKDFGELVFRQQLLYEGVVLLRLEGLSNETKAVIVANILKNRGAEMSNAFSVITPGNLRIRKRR